MKALIWIGLIAVTAALAAAVSAQEKAPEPAAGAAGDSPRRLAPESAEAPKWVTEPFGGKDLEGWKVKGPEEKNKWKVGVAAIDPESPKQLVVKEGQGEMVNVVGGPHGKGVDIYSVAKWGDCRIEVEVMVPQGSNSGIYLMGEYEIQVLDSYGKEKVGPGDMGGIYGGTAPKVNASRKPGEWQKYVIDFKAPQFDAEGKKTANAVFLRVELNGQVLHENVEVAKSTGGALTGKEHPTGPILFQGDHGPVAYRNIRVTPLARETQADKPPEAKE